MEFKNVIIEDGIKVIDCSGMAEWTTANVTDLDNLLVAEWNTIGNTLDITLSSD